MKILITFIQTCTLLKISWIFNWKLRWNFNFWWMMVWFIPNWVKFSRILNIQPRNTWKDNFWWLNVWLNQNCVNSNRKIYFYKPETEFKLDSESCSRQKEISSEKYQKICIQFYYSFDFVKKLLAKLYRITKNILNWLNNFCKVIGLPKLFKKN